MNGSKRTQFTRQSDPKVEKGRPVEPNPTSRIAPSKFYGRTPVGPKNIADRREKHGSPKTMQRGTPNLDPEQENREGA